MSVCVTDVTQRDAVSFPRLLERSRLKPVRTLMFVVLTFLLSRARLLEHSTGRS